MKAPSSLGQQHSQGYLYVFVFVSISLKANTIQSSLMTFIVQANCMQQNALTETNNVCVRLCSCLHISY